VLSRPEEAAKKKARYAALLRQKTIPWDALRDLVQEADSREKLAVTKLTQQYRVQVYETFWTQHDEYRLRQESLNRVLLAWEKSGKSFSQQGKMLAWLEAAMRSAMPATQGPVPPDPVLTADADANATASGAEPQPNKPDQDKPDKDKPNKEDEKHAPNQDAPPGKPAKSSLGETAPAGPEKKEPLDPTKKREDKPAKSDAKPGIKPDEDTPRQSATKPRQAPNLPALPHEPVALLPPRDNGRKAIAHDYRPGALLADWPGAKVIPVAVVSRQAKPGDMAELAAVTPDVVGRLDTATARQLLAAPAIATDAEPSMVAPPAVTVNVDELAARIAAVNLELRALESELDDPQRWDCPRLAPLAQRLKVLLRRWSDLSTYRDLVPESQQGLVGELESFQTIIPQLAQRLFEARTFAHSAAFSGTPAERQAELDGLDGLSRELAAHVAER
jgi:hypothetical protein